MKKFTLVAAAAAMAVCANAQYTPKTPYADITTATGKTYDVVVVDEGTIDALKGAGKTVNDYRVNGDNINFWVWGETMIGGDASMYPGVGYDDYQYDGYTALEVSDKGWSGGGYATGKNDDNETYISGTGVNLTHWTEATRFHVAFRSSNEPASIALIIADSENELGSIPAKVAVGSEAFVDNGAVYPLVGAFDPDGEWSAVDISFADLKKLVPTFDYKNVADWHGNLLSILAGGVTGTNFSIDALYFYTPVSGGIEAVGTAAEDVDIVVTANTVNASGAASIELYNVAGQLVKSAAGTVVGIDDLSTGLYIVKAGNTVKKILVK